MVSTRRFVEKGWLATSSFVIDELEPGYGEWSLLTTTGAEATSHGEAPEPTLQESRPRYDGSRQRRFAVAFAVMLVTSVIVAAPAVAGGKERDTTTTTTTTTTSAPTTTTTTTVAPDSGSGDFSQWEDASSLGSYSAGQYSGSMYWITNKATGAKDFWTAGYTGAGIDVALIDTGWCLSTVSGGRVR